MAGHDDVVIAGAGPAGALAALLLARSGARVTLIDRSRFPRPKLCGDTLNPGAVALLGRHLDLAPLAARARPIDGVLLSGPGPVIVRGEYGSGTKGLVVSRDVFDAWLVAQAVAAGARLEEATTVIGPERDGQGTVRGVQVRLSSGAIRVHRATITLGAEGRRSRLGEACGLSACAMRPRRWAVGAYFARVEGLSSLGEMHVRSGHYLGVAPAVDGLANACLVQPWSGRGEQWAAPDALLRSRLDADPVLGPRFAGAVPATRTLVLGPLAIDTRVPGCRGLLLVGDAAGFIDPMTGDGIRLALESAEAAASVVGDVLHARVDLGRAHDVYREALQRRVARKRRFNRAMRGLVNSPRGVALAARLAHVWPAALAAAVRYAGDVGAEAAS